MTFTSSSVYLHPHIRSHTFAHTHTQWAHSHSLRFSHTHRPTEKNTNRLHSLSGNEKSISFYIFFINNSVSQFGSQRRQLGWCPNSRQSQFFGIFLVFSTLKMSFINSLFSIQCIYLYRYCFFIPVKPKNIKHISCTFNPIHNAKQAARLMIKPNMQCFNASTHTHSGQTETNDLTLSSLQTPAHATLPLWEPVRATLNQPRAAP